MSREYYLRRSWEQFVVDQNPSVALMLGGGGDCKPEVLVGAARQFFGRIQRLAHGPRWANRPKEDWLMAVGFIEKLDTNPHLHLAVRTNSGEAGILLIKGSQIWKGLRHKGDYHCEYIADAEAYVHYSTKELGKRLNYEHAFIYP